MVKCKACGEFMLRTDSKVHLQRFQDEEAVKTAAMAGDTSKLEAFIAHGFSVNKPLAALYGFSRTQ